MGTIILARHGESEANRAKLFSVSEDVPLTELGRQQAAELAELIARRFSPRRLFASEFLRARQTAAVVGERIGLTVEIVRGIHERDFGSLKGHPYEKLRELIAADPAYDAAREWLWTPEGGESRDAVRRRVMPALEALRARYPNDEIVVVCHGVVMVAVWAHLTGTWEGAAVPGNCGMVVVPHEAAGFGKPSVIEPGAAGESEADR